jgi:hypothetical protein
MLECTLLASAEAAATTMELERKAIAVLVEAVVGRYRACALRAHC